MKTKLKTAIALLLSLTMVLTLMSCAPKKEIVITEKSGEILFPKQIDLSILIGSHPSWPYNENFLFWKYFREATGANLTVTSFPINEFATKLSLIMASKKQLPDMIHMIEKIWVDQYAADGAFVAIDDYLDKMPNYTKFWNSIPKETRDAFLVQRLSSDGKTYFPQVYGYDRVMNLQVWMYRRDVFEKNNLKAPETLNDMYNVAKQLKKLYPDSYPVCMRDGFERFNLIGSEFKPYFTYGVYYDFPNKKWSYGATEPTMLELVKYFIKLRDEGLIPPDYLTINTKSWEELVSTDRGFMLPEYMVRFDFFNIPNRKRDPKFTLSIMTPPRANTPTGQNKVAKFNVDPTGYIICNTGKKDRIENSIKLLDWMYSDEAAQLLSWGKEGESYKAINGRKEFISDEGVNPTAKYGVLSYGLYQRLDPAAVTVAYSDEQASMTDTAINQLESNINPVKWLALNSEENAVVKDLKETISSYVKEELSKFLLGQEPLSNWDAFQKELSEIGVDKLVGVYDSAYNRAMSGKK